MKKFFNSLTLMLALMLGGGITGIAQTTLNAGDVVILEFNGNGTDGFTFMPLVDLSAGTMIHFTDYGWDGLAFNPGEDGNPTNGGNMITYTAPSVIPAGTLIRQNTANIGGSNFAATAGWSYNFNNLNYIFSFNTGGTIDNSNEGLFIFQGTPSSPIFIWGYHTGQWGHGAYLQNFWSELPSGLTNGTNAVFFPNLATGTDLTVDDGYYSGPITAASAAGWLARVSNSANWTTSAISTAPTLLYPNTFTVSITSVAPTVTTQAVSSIATTTATGNGNITSLGSPDPTAHGVCWNTTGAPTVLDSKVNNGATSATGAFTASMTSLSANTTYYVRAYATNTGGTIYGTEVSFTTLPLAPTVTTQAVSSITSTSSTGNGNVTSLGVPNPTAHGVCWNTTGFPSILDSKVDNGAKSSTGAFIASMTSLSANTTYYVRAYATNIAGTSYGSEVSFTTSPIAPTVTTQAVSSITASTATGNGNITSLGVPNPTAHGVCWNTTGTPTVSDSKVNNGATSATGAFTAAITSLSANTTYYVRAYATNNGGTSYGAEVSFTTIPDNYAPTDISISEISVNENVPANSVVGTLSTTDADAGNTFTYSLIAGAGSTNNASFNISGNSLLISNSPDFETQSIYSVRVRTTDQGSLTYEKVFTIIINNVNETPVVTAAQAFTIDENLANSTTVGTIVATDQDVPTTFSSWAITGGNTNNAFAIGSSTGVVTVNNSLMLDRELVSSYNLTVTVSDGVNTSAPETVLINLTDLNDVAPVITAAQAFTIIENLPNSNSIGTVVATDGDVTPTLFSIWAITGGNTNNAFAINASTGEITVNTSSALDYESVPSFSLYIQVSDGLHSASDNVTVTLNNVNEAPSDLNLSVSSVNENVAGNTTTGTLSTTDVDAADTFTYTLVAGIGDTDNASFDISGNDLRIISSPNYELNSSYTVRIRTTDGGGLTYEEVIIITINDMDEAAVVTTEAVSNISTYTATGNGTITDLGDPDPTEYGVCWNTTGVPTTTDSKTTQGAVSTTGAYISSMTSLNANTTYFVRAYAANAAGTSYGNEVSFTTLPEATTIAFNTTSSNGLESVSSVNLEVNLSAVSGQDVTVDYTVTGTATGNGIDYTLANGTLTISTGNTTSNITITNIVDDLMVEGDETIIVTLSNPINATLGTNTVHTYTLNDNTTHVSDISKSELSVYPNPFTDNIHLDNISSDISLIIMFDLSGKTVFKADYKGEKDININQLISGVYLLTLVNNNGEKQMIKLVKE